MKNPPERLLRPGAPTPPIRMGMRRSDTKTRLEIALAVFLRCVAVLWIVEGAAQWLTVLGNPDDIVLGYASPLRITAMFFFCILDFVAAVGLWLVTSWGAAIWIATMLGHGLVTVFSTGILAEPALTLVADVILVAVYAMLSIATSRERRLA